MKKGIFLLFVLLSTIFMSVTAQIRSKKACFYLEAGRDPNSSASDWFATIFRDNGAHVRNNLGETLVTIRGCLKKNVNYFEDLNIIHRQNGWIYEYVPSLSTDSYFVYRMDDWFLAFSKDNSQLIRWREKNDKIIDKRHYIRVDKSEVMPKGVNRDFLE